MLEFLEFSFSFSKERASWELFHFGRIGKEFLNWEKKRKRKNALQKSRLGTDNAGIFFFSKERTNWESFHFGKDLEGIPQAGEKTKGKKKKIPEIFFGGSSLFPGGLI